MTPPADTSGCPICGRPQADRHRPFCSPRCKQIDLGRWLNESYRLPAETEESPDEDGIEGAEAGHPQN